MACRHRSLEIVSSDEIKKTVRCTHCKEIIAEWTLEHLEERFDTVFGKVNETGYESTIPVKQSEFLRELTETEREELR